MKTMIHAWFKVLSRDSRASDSSELHVVVRHLRDILRNGDGKDVMIASLQEMGNICDNLAAELADIP